MGCWNETCMVTNLPILVGDPVVAQVIVRTRFNNSERSAVKTSSPHDRFTAVGYPFRAKYNDYGYIEGIPDDAYTNDTLAYIRDRMMERPQGENPYHDHEVRKDKLSWGSFGNWIHSGRLLLGNGTLLSGRPVGLVMIHQPVYEAMVAYRGDADRLDPIDKDAIDTILAEPPAEYEDLEYLKKFKLREKMHHYLRDRELNNPRDLVWDIGETAERLTEMAHFDRALTYARRQWHPTSGAGSQSEEWGLYRVINKAGEAIARKREDDLGEENEDA